MPKDSTKKPRDFDAVLGNNTPLKSGLVLGGSGGRRRFSHKTENQKLSIFDEALKYGDFQIDFLIEAMHDEDFNVRVNAYAILQNLNSSKAKQIVKDGLHFRKGDYFYQVYESAIIPYKGWGWNEIKDYVMDNFVNDEFYDNSKLISNHLLKRTADEKANLLHQHKMLRVDICNLPLDFEYFDIYQWCQDNNVFQHMYSKHELGEYYEYYEYDYCQLFEMLQNRNDIYLMEQLWRLMGLDKLAFVYRRVVREDINLHFTLSG